MPLGDAMDICVDCWGRFDLPSAQRIARALEPYNILYLEDVMLMNNAQSYAALASETSVPICMSETLATRYEYREFFESKACDVVMYDLTWCGGNFLKRRKYLIWRILISSQLLHIPVEGRYCGLHPFT